MRKCCEKSERDKKKLRAAWKKMLSWRSAPREGGRLRWQECGHQKKPSTKSKSYRVVHVIDNRLETENISIKVMSGQAGSLQVRVQKHDGGGRQSSVDFLSWKIPGFILGKYYFQMWQWRWLVERSNISNSIVSNVFDRICVENYSLQSR